MSYEEDRIGNIKKKLNSPNAKVGQDIRHKFSKKKYNVSSQWNDDLSLRSESTNEKVNQTFAKNKHKEKFRVLVPLLILSFIFFAGALAYAYFSINNNRSVISNKNINIETVTPVSIGAGEVLPIEISVTNNNPGPIEEINLVVKYPEGSRRADDVSQELQREVISIGEMSAGEIVRKEVEGIVFGKKGDRAKIDISLQYNAKDSSATFTKEKSIDVALSSPPIIATIDSISEITSGQNLSLDLNIESNADTTLEDVIIVAKYPFGFSLVDSNIEPFFNDRVWSVGDLRPNESKKLTINGLMQGQNQEERFFDFTVGIQDDQIEEEIAIALNQVGHTVQISKPFLAAEMTLNGQTAETVSRDSGQNVSGQISLQNTTSNTIQNIKLDLDLNGDLIDKFSVDSRDGFFDSRNNRLTWDRNTTENLRTIRAGQSQDLSFNFNIKSLYDVPSFSINPEVLLNASVSGDRPGDNNVASSIDSSIRKRIKVASMFGVNGETRYSTGPIQNNGPIPPKVEQTTTYSIIWSVSNSANTIEDTRMTAKLPPSVSWTGVINPQDENVDYNQNTREVTWQIGEVAPKTGFSRPLETLAFQVALNPSASQSGQEVVLLEDIRFVGYDSFAEVNRERQLESFTTRTADIAERDDARVSRD